MSDSLFPKKNIQTTFGHGNTQAGRDIIQNYYPEKNKTMKALIAAYKKEQSEDIEFHPIIEEL